MKVEEKEKIEEDIIEGQIEIAELSQENEIKYEQKKEEQVEKEEQAEKKSKHIIPIITLLIFIGLILSTIFSVININNQTIIKGITINNINVSGMTEEEAINKINNIIEEKVSRTIKLENKDWKYYLDANQIELQYNTEEVVKKVYLMGREGNIFKDNFAIAKALIIGENLEVAFEYSEELMKGLLIDINSQLPDKKEEPSYSIEDDKLIITKGHSGNTIRKAEVEKLILDKMKNNDGIPIKINIEFSEESKIDIDKIYLEVCKESQNAYYTTEPFEIFAHVNGIKFDIQKAKELLKEDKEKYEIELIITEPDVLTNEIGTEAFPNLLSSFSTKYDESNKNRSNNLKLAGATLNGLVVMPGETFSYNGALGERTAKKGYKAAGGYSGGRVIQTIGGGICQISSTLYDAVVYANLKIVDRSNHMFTTGYIPAGRDATVSYGAVDFKFENTRKYPIMIKADINNGVAKIEIYGVKENKEYEIEIESKILSYISYKTVYEDNQSLAPGTEKTIQGGMRGCKTIAYKVFKQNGVEVSREILSEDTYRPMNKIIQKGPEVAQKESEPQPTSEETQQIIPETNIVNESKPSSDGTDELQPVIPENGVALPQ